MTAGRGERLLRRLLRTVLPSSFASDWGDEIVATMLDRAADARAAGLAVWIAFAVREAASLGVLAWRTRRGEPLPFTRRCPMLTDPQDTRRYRIAWAIALAVHFVAFAVVFPFGGGSLQAAPERDLTAITVYHPPKPPERVETTTVKRRSQPVPIPDATPDEPEPIVSEIDSVYVPPREPVDLEFEVGAPAEPPAREPQRGIVRVGADVQRPAQLVRVEPEYPEIARRARLQCTVILETRIGRQGDVEDVEVLRGCGIGLDEAAVRAVSQWKYAPTTIDGRPVEVSMTVTVVFRLQ